MGGVRGQGFRGIPGVDLCCLFAASMYAIRISASLSRVAGEAAAGIGTCMVLRAGSREGIGMAGGVALRTGLPRPPRVVLASFGGHANHLGGDFGGVLIVVTFSAIRCVPPAGTFGGVLTWMPFAITSRTISGVYAPAGHGGPWRAAPLAAMCP